MRLLKLIIIVNFCTLNISAQKLTFRINFNLSRSWRSLVATDSNAQLAQKTLRDPFEKPTVSFKLGLDILYPNSESLKLIVPVNILNYRNFGHKPDVYVEDPNWVGGKMILGGKYYYNYLYGQIGLGLEYKIAKLKSTLSARMNTNIPLITIFTTKRGSYPDGKTVGRGVAKNLNRVFNVSPEVRFEKDVKIRNNLFSTSISAEWFLVPISNVPIREYPVFYSIGVGYNLK